MSRLRLSGEYDSLTTKFFGMKLAATSTTRYVSQKTLAKVAAKNPRNGVLNPNIFWRRMIQKDEIIDAKLLNHPLAQYMFCAPDEGRGGDHVQRASTPGSHSFAQDSTPSGDRS